jgi:hypothetical protein
MACAVAMTIGLATVRGEERMIAWSKLKPSRINAAPAEAAIVDAFGGSALALSGEGPATIVVLAPRAGWNLLARHRLGAFFKNTGTTALEVTVSWADDSGKEGLTTRQALTAGASTQWLIPIPGGTLRLTRPLALEGMNGAPTGYDGLDLGRVTRMLIKLTPNAEEAWQISLGDVWAEGEAVVFDADTFLPFVDEFGQFIHQEWPGKVHSEEDFVRRHEEEQVDLETHPRPAAWNRYGGWQGGPKSTATGHFRVEKEAPDGRWWLIDPEGCRFWSWGLNCVRSNWDHTPVSDRETYFRWLPKPPSPYAEFFAEGTWAPVGWYKDKGPYRMYSFLAANLLRKYGSQWPSAADADVRLRLPSWGMNTLGNWSDLPRIHDKGLAYVIAVHYAGPEIAGSQGQWGRFPDVFDPLFRSQVRAAMAQTVKPHAVDPWCLGVFVDNELNWGDETSLALAVLASPGDQKAKVAMVSQLKKKYRDIAILNTAWGTRHRDWKGLRNSQKTPDLELARADLVAFTETLAETYFATVREELKTVAPDLLYLGCRFAWRNDIAVRTAARHCDVLTYNLYEASVTHFALPAEVDRPVLVGEFHFGALDRGLFHPGLREVRSQAERAEAMRQYVFGAMANPNIVGAHWFQYRDQPLTGRGDGENYQIGFVDICDNPYPETIAASRDIGAQLYPSLPGQDTTEPPPDQHDTPAPPVPAGQEAAP